MALVTNLKINNDEISFDLNNNLNKLKNSFSNAIRRMIISNVYTYTIDNNSIIIIPLLIILLCVWIFILSFIIFKKLFDAHKKCRLLQ